MLGINSKEAILYDYNEDYIIIAKEMIQRLKEILKDKFIKIEHVGSTAIKGIKSKPIIDIVIGLDNFDNVNEIKEILERSNILFSKIKLNNSVIAFKSEIDGKRTHNIYLILFEGIRWEEFVLFRDYLNKNFECAKEYEKLKIQLSKNYENDIHSYTEGKAVFISEVLKKVEQESKC